MTGEMVEKTHHIARQLGVAAQQSEISIEASRLNVIVACPNVDVAP